MPESGGAAFEILAEAEIVPANLGKALSRMVGFGNILVPDYARLDPAVVLRILQTDLADIERFRNAILQAIPLPDPGPTP